MCLVIIVVKFIYKLTVLQSKCDIRKDKCILPDSRVIYTYSICHFAETRINGSYVFANDFEIYLLNYSQINCVHKQII